MLGFDMRIVRRRAGTEVIEPDFVEACPGIQHPEAELRTVVDLDPPRQPAGCLDFLRFFADLFALDRFFYANN